MNQEQIVLTALKKGSITQKDMIRAGVFRLAARVKDLRDKGHPIQTHIETGFNQYGHSVRFARYYLK